MVEPRWRGGRCTAGLDAGFGRRVWTPGLRGGLDAGFARRVWTPGLRGGFGRRVCAAGLYGGQGLDAGFGRRVCAAGLRGGLDAGFARRVWTPGLRGGFGRRVCAAGLDAGFARRVCTAGRVWTPELTAGYRAAGCWLDERRRCTCRVQSPSLVPSCTLLLHRSTQAPAEQHSPTAPASPVDQLINFRPVQQPPRSAAHHFLRAY